MGTHTHIHTNARIVLTRYKLQAVQCTNRLKVIHFSMHLAFNTFHCYFPFCCRSSPFIYWLTFALDRSVFYCCSCCFLLVCCRCGTWWWCCRCRRRRCYRHCEWNTKSWNTWAHYHRSIAFSKRSIKKFSQKRLNFNIQLHLLTVSSTYIFLFLNIFPPSRFSVLQLSNTIFICLT